MPTRGIMDRLWKALSHPRTAVLALLLLLAIQIVGIVLPQIPAAAGDPAAYNRWLAILRPSLGDQTKTLASLGLLTVRSSYLLRLTLGLVGLLIVANVESLRETWQAMPWPSGHTGRLALILGGLLVIGGWAGQLVWGWQEPEIIAWPGTAITVENHGVSIPQPSGPFGFWKGGYGLYVLRHGQRTGLEIQATDESRQTLLLLPSVNQDPQPTLRLAFTAQKPEAFFAIQQAGLIFRLNELQDEIQVQAYRSASGELLKETVVPSAAEPVALQVNGATVTLAPVLLPRYEVVRNPGALFEGLGIILLTAGVALQIADRSKGEQVTSEEAEASSELEAA